MHSQYSYHSDTRCALLTLTETIDIHHHTMPNANGFVTWNLIFIAWRAMPIYCYMTTHACLELMSQHYRMYRTWNIRLIFLHKIDIPVLTQCFPSMTQSWAKISLSFECKGCVQRLFFFMLSQFYASHKMNTFRSSNTAYKCTSVPGLLLGTKVLMANAIS